MKIEKPIRVLPGRGRHRTENRVFAREIFETFCVHRGCRFRGKHAQQGVCHTTETFAGGTSWDYIDRAEKAAEEALAEERRLGRKEGRNGYLRRLEALFVCGWMNSIFGLDELIRLRRRVALLEIGKQTRKKRRGE